MPFLKLTDQDLSAKTILIRADMNVPLQDGIIGDDTRIRASLASIRHCIDQGAAVIVMTHLGRPTEGAPKPADSVAPVAERLGALLGQPVAVLENWRDGKPNLPAGTVAMLPNVRLNVGEKKNDPDLGKAYAALCDIYVNDAFGTAHRAHASTEGVAHYLPAVSGFLIEKELKFLGGAVEHPDRPFVAILGGAKVSDKIGVINNLLEKVDILIVGGGMAYTFIKAQGGEISKSLLEADRLEYALEMLEKAKEKGVKLLLPEDSVAADAYSNDAKIEVVDSYKIPEGYLGLDIGPKAQKAFAEAIRGAKTVVWNGPMGVSEMSNFAAGTVAVAKAMAESEAVTIIGGGDSAAAVVQLGFGDKMSHISTGGGASLEFLEGLELPGVAALNDI